MTNSGESREKEMWMLNKIGNRKTPDIPYMYRLNMRGFWLLLVHLVIWFLKPASAVPVTTTSGLANR
jgi:hypothetical protein